jgi:hypothetical protein
MGKTHAIKELNKNNRTLVTPLFRRNLLYVNVTLNVGNKDVKM